MKTEVLMLNTIQGRDDDANGVITYIEGRKYNIGESLLSAFIEQGVVQIAGEYIEPESRETKVIEPEEPKKRKYTRKA